jgi:hypothetical protein
MYAIWTSRIGNAVKVILTSWAKDDLGVMSEIAELEDIFDRVYQYEVEKWQIPSEKPERALRAKVTSLLEGWESNKSLLMFYYAGHAQPSSNSGSYPIWTS